MSIDEKSTIESLFGNLKKKNDADPPATVETVHGEERVTLVIKRIHKRHLDDIAKALMIHRSQKLKGNPNKDRITFNTLIRALVEVFLSKTIYSLDVLAKEKDVREWIKALFNK